MFSAQLSILLIISIDMVFSIVSIVLIHFFMIFLHFLLTLGMMFAEKIAVAVALRV